MRATGNRLKIAVDVVFAIVVVVGSIMGINYINSQTQLAQEAVRKTSHYSEPYRSERGWDFLLVSMVVKPEYSYKEVEEDVLSAAHSWYRFTRGQWLVYGEHSIEFWHEGLGQYSHPEGQLFIARLDLEAVPAGWMTTDFWNWLQGIRPEKKEKKDVDPR